MVPQMTDFPEIPDFLVVMRGDPSPSWHGYRLTDGRGADSDRHPWHLPRSMDAVSHALLREREGEKERKKQESLAALKAWKLENRR
jgi:hypothetical protein